jgi:excisionase family DNA binding protein
MKLLPISIVAERLGVSTETIYRMGRDGKISIIRIGAKKGYRITESEFLKYLDRQIRRSGSAK